MAKRRNTNTNAKTDLTDLTDIGMADLDGLEDISKTEVEALIESGSEQELLEEDKDQEDPDKDKECQLDQDPQVTNQLEKLPLKKEKDSGKKLENPEKESLSSKEKESTPQKVSELKKQASKMPEQEQKNLPKNGEQLGRKSVKQTKPKENVSEVRAKKSKKIPTENNPETPVAAKIPSKSLPIAHIVRPKIQNSNRSTVRLFHR